LFDLLVILPELYDVIEQITPNMPNNLRGVFSGQQVNFIPETGNIVKFAVILIFSSNLMPVSDSSGSLFSIWLLYPAEGR